MANGGLAFAAGLAQGLGRSADIYLANLLSSRRERKREDFEKEQNDLKMLMQRDQVVMKQRMDTIDMLLSTANNMVDAGGEMTPAGKNIQAQALQMLQQNAVSPSLIKMWPGIMGTEAEKIAKQEPVERLFGGRGMETTPASGQVPTPTPPGTPGAPGAAGGVDRSGLPSVGGNISKYDNPLSRWFRENVIDVNKYVEEQKSRKEKKKLANVKKMAAAAKKIMKSGGETKKGGVGENINVFSPDKDYYKRRAYSEDALITKFDEIKKGKEAETEIRKLLEGTGFIGTGRAIETPLMEVVSNLESERKRTREGIPVGPPSRRTPGKKMPVGALTKETEDQLDEHFFKKYLAESIGTAKKSPEIRELLGERQTRYGGASTATPQAGTVDEITSWVKDAETAIDMARRFALMEDKGKQTSVYKKLKSVLSEDELRGFLLNLRSISPRSVSKLQAELGATGR